MFKQNRSLQQQPTSSQFAIGVIMKVVVLIGDYYRLLDSLVVECWLRVREVPGSIPSQGPPPR